MDVNPLDQAGLEQVTDAVTSLRGLQGVVSDSDANGDDLLVAVRHLEGKLDLITNGVAEDTLVGAAGFGNDDLPNGITANNLTDANALLTAMSASQRDDVLADIQQSDAVDLTQLARDISQFMGVDPSNIPAALASFNDLSVERRELVFETIESQGGLSGLEDGVGFEAFVSGPIVTNIVATPSVSPNDTYVADADTEAGPGLSVQCILTKRWIPLLRQH